MNTPYDLILFDLDGTLIETAPEIADAVNDTLRAHGLGHIPEMEVARWIGHGTHDLLVQAFAWATVRSAADVRVDDTLPAISQLFDQHYAQRCGTRSRPYPDMRRTIAALRRQGTALAVVTNKEGRHTDRLLAAHGLTDAFDWVISGDTLATKKPDPAGIEHCLKAAGVPAARALFVGDSSIDADTARRAGLAVWLLPHGYNMGRPLADAAPDRIVADFGELAVHLLRAPLPTGEIA